MAVFSRYQSDEILKEAAEERMGEVCFGAYKVFVIVVLLTKALTLVGC